MNLAGNAANIRRAAAAAGAASLLAQVVLLREILACSQGNELVLGIVLGVWLCLTGVASALGAIPSWQPQRARSVLSWLLSLAPLLYLGALWLTRLGRPDALGEAPRLHAILLTSLVALLPACGLGGFAYAWAIKASSKQESPAVYIAETVGATAAGLLFHFVLGERLSSVWTLWLAGAVCAVGGILVGWPLRRTQSLGLSLVAAVASALLGPTVAASVEAARFRGETILTSRPSRYGLLTVLARGGQRVFLQDGVLLFTSEDQIAAEERVHLPMLLHPAPRRVLLLGGGLGGGLAEALKHHPERIDYVEVDPGLLGLAARFAGLETRAALSDSRVHVAVADGRSLLRRARQQYDVILVDAPVPQNALMARYTSREAFQDARRALASGGILALVTPGSDTHLGEAARQRHSTVLSTLGDAFPFVGSAPGATTILWASTEPVDATPAVLVRRLKDRHLNLAEVGPTWLWDRLLPMHVASYRQAVARTLPVESRDFRPVVYLFGLVEMLQTLSPALARGALAVALGRKRWVAVGAGLIVVAVVLGLWRRRQSPGFGVAVAGATGMMLQLVLLLAYQSLRGHLYHGLGLLFAAFMAGMAVGALAGGRFAGQRRALAAAIGVEAVVALAVCLLLQMARGVPEAATVIISVALLAVGATSGAVYPLAVSAAADARAGARMYAWDLVGAAGAALVTSLVAIPLFGLVPVVLAGALLCTLAALVNRGRARS